MSLSFELSIDVSERYPFNDNLPDRIIMNPWVRNQWPLVYFIENNKTKIAYVGESTNALNRMKNHLASPERRKLNTVTLIGSDKFNKSATLDIESNLIQYITAEGTYQLQNANFGLSNHNYYQQDLYRNLFKAIWDKLIERKIVTKTLTEIENTEFFKYSPYKSLNEDQYNSIQEILEGLTHKEANRIFISGSAGTGKTILASYLIKLLSTDIETLEREDNNDDEIKEVDYVKKFKAKYPKGKIGLVIAMTSLRDTLKGVFRLIPGLNPNMVIGPSDTFRSKEKYDLLIVDEAHRLRQYRNLSWMGAFRKNNERLGLDDRGTELDWILANSKNQIFFYDAAQSVKPSDIDPYRFQELLEDPHVLKLELKSQMRVRGGNDYISFIDNLINSKLDSDEKFENEDYEFVLFEDFNNLRDKLREKEQEFGLCRMIAGYSWPWLSKEDNSVTDIELDGLKFRWNSTEKDWINSENAFEEIGCIHTTQGYDLNYTAIIFGKEIDYDKDSGQIIINPSEYYDKNGKRGIRDTAVLKDYIINIYKTIMYRGIRGTFVYVCNKNLRDYFKQHIATYIAENNKVVSNIIPFRIIEEGEVKPYINSIPLVDISAAAGSFSDLQVHSDFTWVEPPSNVTAKKGYFICKVEGESMNEIIPNGSYCLFKQDEGGSRNGEIVLIELTDMRDSEFGSRYTVKQYESTKTITEEGWHHTKVTLKPKSDLDDYENIILEDDALTSFKVVGIFVKLLMA